MPITYRHDDRPLLPALLRGFHRRCPACGCAPAFAGYLKLVPACTACGAPLGQIRADDFPPYVTILLVGHIVVPLILLVEQISPLSLGLQMAIWPLLTLLLTLALLPLLKGAVVGLMWSLRLRGGDDQPAVEELRSRG